MIVCGFAGESTIDVSQPIEESPVPLLVRLRPNAPYLLFMLIAAASVAYGVARADLLGVVIAVAGALLLALFGYPVVASTILRVPVVVVGNEGIRLPLMGVRLGWSEVSAAKRGVDLSGRARKQVLLIFPAAPNAVLDQVFPWLRREARGNIARYGAPIVLSGLSLDHSIDDIAAAIHQHRPTS
jgi:hypothetical protein